MTGAISGPTDGESHHVSVTLRTRSFDEILLVVYDADSVLLYPFLFTLLTMSFLSAWDLSDVILKVEGRCVYVNKSVMSMWSPVMKAMFHGHFRERNADVVELPGKNCDDVLELVRVLHPPNKEIDGR